MKLNVFVGCEFSATVARAFHRLGHTVVTCDLLPSEERRLFIPHYQGDVFEALDYFTEECNVSFDLIILHPPCTALCVSGNRWYGKGMPKHTERLKALKWTAELWTRAKELAPFCAMENPVGVLNKYGSVFPKPSYVQPYQFGHAETKKTGLWLHRLPPLVDTENVYDTMMQLPLKERQRIWYMSPSDDRNKERSRTYPGIAEAMAVQWGEYIQALKQEKNQ